MTACGMCSPPMPSCGTGIVITPWDSDKHGKLAQFRMDRMTGAELLEESAVPGTGFDAADYVRGVFGMYGTPIRRVELLCENETMRSVVDRFGEDVRIETVDGRHFRATVEAAPSPPFYAWVFTFGGKIRLVRPPEALAEMRRMASWLKKMPSRCAQGLISGYQEEVFPFRDTSFPPP